MYKKSLLSTKVRSALPAVLVDAARRKGWKVKGPALQTGREVYLCWVEHTPEVRRERLEGALAVAVLRARAATARSPKGPRPLAIVSAPRVSERLEARLAGFMDSAGAGVAWGIVDDAGRVLLKAGAVMLDQPAAVKPRQPPAVVSGELFSDLNQWLLKVLLCDRFPSERLRRVDGAPFRNASVLAEAAGVSLPVVTRLLRRLKVEGFVDSRQGFIELVRVPELLARWRDAMARAVRAEYRVRLKDSGSTVGRWLLEQSGIDPHLRLVFGLFDAADLLGARHVANAPHIVYLEHEDWQVDHKLLKGIDLLPVGPQDPCDFLVRVPRFPEAVFRAAVHRPDDDLGDQLVDHYTDVLQTWMDVSHHAARGSELAATIWNNLIQPCLTHDD